MTSWPSLVSAAILGTERKKPAVEPQDGALGELLARIDSSSGDIEAGLLGMAAAASLYERSGVVAGRIDVVDWENRVVDERRRCSRHVADLLHGILADGREKNLVEWLELARHAGVRPPEEMIPDLLDAAVARRLDRHLVRAVSGKVGQWLAARNPRWAFARELGESDEETWETEGREERAMALEAARRRDPERGRGMLESTWERESVEDRALFLELFEHGLSSDDESFIEKGLDDRRAEVRSVAARLLRMLPGSGYLQRMVERAEPLLELEQKGMLRRKGRLEVKLPATCDAAMVRDGIRKKPPTGIGEGGWWLFQILSLVPPSHWSDRWGKSPEEILEAAAQSEWAEALTHAWISAAFDYHDEPWVRAIVQKRLLEQPAPNWLLRSTSDLLTMFASPSDQRLLEELLLPLFEKKRSALRSDLTLRLLVESTDGPIGEKLSRVIVAAIVGTFGGKGATLGDQEWWVISLINGLGPRLTPTLWPEIAAIIPSDGAEYVHTALGNLVTTLRFREEMHKAFEEDQSS